MFWGRRRPAPSRGARFEPVHQTVTERKAECSICFEQLAGLTNNPVVALCSGRNSCGHFIHKRCAERLAPRHCPICRTPFETLKEIPGVEHPRAWFDAVDADGNRSLSQREVATALKATVADLDPEAFDRELPSLWRRWDRNGDGALSYEELLGPGGLLEYVRGGLLGRAREREPPPLSRPTEWFSFWDYDGSGELDRAEVRRALVKTFNLEGDHERITTMGETLQAVWGIFDTDGSGEIDRREFSQAGGLGETLAASLGPVPTRPAAEPHYAAPSAYAPQPYAQSVGPQPVYEAVVVDAGPADAPPLYSSPGLPPGWESRVAPDGRQYYVNHNTQTTSWARPG
mmetsp:Transcript_13745/g.42570  ORF Transcript_13745/g.42570 Transcript_13745/m.42570 type:complete len:344 (+) Transcript_13745:1078-2109(+)